MKKNADVIFGVVGTGSTLTLSQINLVLGCIAGVLTVIVMTIRLRREWKHRNDPPEDK